MNKTKCVPIEVLAGVQPSTDKTALSTPHFTMSDKIRFRFGFPQKIGGWAHQAFNYSATISGYARSIYGALISTTINTVIGTNLKLYSLINSTLVNITPLSASTMAIGASLATDYHTTSNSNPFQFNGSTGSPSINTLDASNTVVYKSGDTITVSGATTFGGFSLGQINTTHILTVVATNQFYQFVMPQGASGIGSGGGASVVIATGNITVTAAAHGLSNGDRVKIAGAADTGGILAASINGEFVIRNVTANTFDIMTAGTATSAVTGGGGAGVTYQKEISGGNQNATASAGYGAGKYGVGLYGTALVSSAGITYPRIWFIDRFGNNLIMSAGNQTGLYSWAGSADVAPALVSGAPTAINYAFVSDNILVTFGAGGTLNRILASDQASSTQWTASSTNQVFDYIVNGAGALRSHVSVNGVNLIYTDHQTYLFQYIGLPGVWKITLLENNIGIIGPMARCSVAGTAYWMDKNNFFMWSGGNVTIIPSNSQQYSTIFNYVFKNMTTSQQSKIFCWYNEQFDEIWWHYPSASSNEPDRVARLNRSDLTWVPDTFDRTCAEYPNLVLGYPRLISSGGTLYQHETGVNADGSAMPWTLTSNMRGGGGPNAVTSGTSLVTSIVPDNVQTGDITLEILSRLYPQSASTLYDSSYTISPNTEFTEVTIGGRLWQYKLSGNAVDQQWMGGLWHENVQDGSPR